MRVFLNKYFPRFITEAVVFNYDEEQENFYPVCALDDVMDDEEFDAVGIVSSFNLFGHCINGKLISDLVSWDDFLERLEVEHEDN